MGSGLFIVSAVCSLCLRKYPEQRLIDDEGRQRKEEQKVSKRSEGKGDKEYGI